MFASMDDVAGEMAQTEGQPARAGAASEIEKRAGEHYDAAQNEKHAPDFAEGFHHRWAGTDFQFTRFRFTVVTEDTVIAVSVTRCTDSARSGPRASASDVCICLNDNRT